MDKSQDEVPEYIKACRELRTLKNDWDGQGACATDPDDVALLEALLRTYPDTQRGHVTACPSGSVMCTWAFGPVYVDVEIEDGEVNWMVCLPDDDLKVKRNVLHYTQGKKRNSA